MSHFFIVLYKFIDFYATISPRHALLYYELLSHSLGLKIHVTAKHADSYLSSVEKLTMYIICVYLYTYIYIYIHIEIEMLHKNIKKSRQRMCLCIVLTD